MKIAVISKATAAGGGASRIAQELTGALNLRAGVEATHWRAQGEYPGTANSASLYGERALLRKGLKALRFASAKAGFQEWIPFELPVVASGAIMEADVLHVHDITNALSPYTLRWLAQRKPVVWTFHDQSPVTGGCIASQGCEGYLADCAACPKTNTWPICGLVPTPGLQLKAKRNLGRAPFWITTPSRWLADIVKESRCYPAQPCRVLSNGIDTEIFAPGPREALRQQLGLNPTKLTLVISAGHLADTSKGIPDAIEVVRAVAACVPTQVIAVGRENPALSQALHGISVCATGYLQSPRMLALSYAAGDALVYCSRADNQPLTVMENMAVGNAIYTYQTGGIPELVDHSSGMVVVPGAVVPLSAAIVADWQAGRLRIKGAHARRRAARDFSIHTMTDSFLSLYSEVILSHPRNAAHD